MFFKPPSLLCILLSPILSSILISVSVSTVQCSYLIFSSHPKVEYKIVLDFPNCTLHACSSFQYACSNMHLSPVFSMHLSPVFSMHAPICMHAPVFSMHAQMLRTLHEKIHYSFKDLITGVIWRNGRGRK